MNITPIIILYVLVGVGCTAVAITRHNLRKPIDLSLLVLFWPIYGPFVLTNPQDKSAAPNPADIPIRQQPGQNQVGHTVEEVFDALRRAADAPMASLLPDLDTGRRLASRLDVAHKHIDEIDKLLTRQPYDETAALERQRTLRDGGDERSAAMIDSRIQIIRRLQTLRARFSQETNQISELLTQLQLQAELVRIAGTTNDDTRELVLELVSRIQGLDAFMDEVSY